MLNRNQLALLMLCPSLALAQSLTLSCDGQGTVMATQSTTVNQYDFKHKENKTGIAQTQVRRPFSGNGMVEISSGTGRMRIPEKSWLTRVGKSLGVDAEVMKQRIGL